jgi:hypothetical protein
MPFILRLRNVAPLLPIRAARAKLRIVLRAVGLVCAGLALQHFWVANHVPHADAIPNPPAIRYLPESALARLESETDLGYVRRMSRLVHNSTYHCEPTDSRVSLIERVLFLEAEDSLEEGFLVRDRFYCGFCHQRSYVLGLILREHGLQATVFALTGHVVLEVVVNGTPYIADPDYGVDPFPYSNDDSTLASLVKARYGDDVARSVGLTDMYLTRKNNTPYFNTPTLDKFASQQVWVFSAARIIAYVLLAIGIILISAGAVIGCHWREE